MIPKAIGDKIIVEKDKLDEAYAGGIIIPAASQRTPTHAGMIEATVLSVGAKVTAMKAGQRIMMRHAWGDDYFYDERILTVLTEREYRDCLLV
jgi:co-chaperonin GroES (HSP10)